MSAGEDAVTVQIQINGKELAAMLDTGANPYVMDMNTVKKTKFINRMVKAPGRVYGLCSNPIPVLG